ncbi:hypothetical protein OESDEN_23082 [Oesophagostomum dentatum]|uniref:Glycoside hydrolase family 31 TIM barrel domain-containing protein n=1 Tax=Oesophagostomum dentatum TaxID=61180 RepID=A0A0B1RW50_OESDE|nr:hypothetical protein OESDEN_23082 [Oesophagostomum dentatum]
MKEKISRNVKLGIPLDTVVADIDYMDRYKDFTTGKKWSGLEEYVKELHKQGMKAIFIIDAGVQADSDSFERGLNAGAQFIEWERYDQVPHYIQDLYPLAKNTKIMLAVVWPDGHVAFS